MTLGDARPPITGATGVIALLGRPIEHALTPVIHNAALAAAGRDVVYVALSPTEEKLEVTLRGLVAGACKGLCITIPFKTAVVRLMDHLAESARVTGAVNTVVVGEDGRLTGHNTDVDGVLACLAALPDSGRRAGVVLGAGGAARSAVAALERAGFAHCRVLNRSLERAEALALDFVHSAMTVAALPLDRENLHATLCDADVVINTTSVGMYPRGDDTPLPAEFLRPGLGVADAVYRPTPTRLIREAEAQGAAVASGIYWIVGQGVEAYRLWLGDEPDAGVMRRAVEDFLAVS